MFGKEHGERLTRIETKVDMLLNEWQTVAESGFPRCARNEEKISQIERSQKRVRNGVIAACIAGLGIAGEWLISRFGG